MQCTVSERHLRRYTAGELRSLRCRPCRHAGRPVVVDDSSRAWWLQQFTDFELAEMAAALTGGEPDLEHIAQERRRLAPALAMREP